MYLETVTGRVINVVDPDPATIAIEDIGWGLSRIPRFCGHSITEVPYNVAQHSIFVAREVENILKNPNEYPELSELNENGSIKYLNLHDQYLTILLGLLHDASEVYTGDIPSPIKQIPELRPIIKKVEHRIMEAVYQAYCLLIPTETQEVIIKHADKIAQRIEAHAFMQSRGNHWPNMPLVSLEKLQKFEAPIPSLESYKLFMAEFNHYYNKYLVSIKSTENQLVKEAP